MGVRRACAVGGLAPTVLSGSALGFLHSLAELAGFAFVGVLARGCGRWLALLSTFLEGVHEVECVSEAVSASAKVAEVPLGLVPLPLVAKLLVHLVDFDF